MGAGRSRHIAPAPQPTSEGGANWKPTSSEPAGSGPPATSGLSLTVDALAAQNGAAHHAASFESDSGTLYARRGQAIELRALVILAEINHESEIDAIKEGLLEEL